MKVRYLEWLVEERVADPEEAIVYEVLPYSPAQADLIIQHLCALAKLDPEQEVTIRRARRVRRAFRYIVDAACARQALLDLNKIESQIAKPPWRDRLRELRHDRGQFAPAIGDKSARAALRWALIDIGQAARAGPRWLHYLRDRPAALRKTIERALEAPVLQGDPGQPRGLDRVLFVRSVGRAYRLLTGRRFGRSTTSETKSRPSGRPMGPGLRLVSICLKPLDPEVSDHAILWAIRRSKRLMLWNNMLIWRDDSAA